MFPTVFFLFFFFLKKRKKLYFYVYNSVWFGKKFCCYIDVCQIYFVTLSTSFVKRKIEKICVIVCELSNMVVTAESY